MNTVIIARDVFDNTNWETYETDDLLKLLAEQFVKFPTSARIYHNNVSLATDVTPNSEDDIEMLSKLEGVFYIMLYPADPITVVVAIVAVVATAAAAFLLKPKIPNLSNAQAPTSPNNGTLSERQNSPRLNGRIPDIYGTVRSIPDLITLPYTFFDGSGTEYELSYMCIGVGDYDISDVKEGETPLIQIAGSSCSFYGPNESPNTSNEKLTIGSNITNPLYSYKKQNAINGQSIPSPATGSLTISTGVIGFTKTFDPSNGNSGGFPTSTTCFITSSAVVSFSTTFAIGDTVTLTSSTNPTMNGTYTVLGFGIQAIFTSTGFGYIDAAKMYLNPLNTNFSENSYEFRTNGSNTKHALNLIGKTGRNLVITKSGSTLLGPFTISDTGITNLIINFIAPNGLYGASAVTIQTKITTISSGAIQTVNTTLAVSSSAGQKGYTANITLTGSSPCTVTIQRTTTAGTNGNDDVKIRDLFYGKAITQSNFGNVTTVYVLSRQSVGSISAKERKFNCLASRKLNTPSGFVATSDAAEIIINMCLDSTIGRRQLSEVDSTGIRETIAAVKAYFGAGGYAKAGEFNYTFDTNGMSFEETILAVASTVHCIPYRLGNVIKLKFERDNTLSTLLFNHRNILPDTHALSVSFGVVNDYDGVTVKYINPLTDQEQVIFVPNSTISNPKEIQYVGIRDKAQAFYLAWRAWNRLKYQNTAVEFTATQESDLITLSDRILVAPINRQDTQAGDIIAQSGLQLTLSIDVTVTNGDTIFIQYYDGTVGNLTINGQVSTNIISLASAPALPLVLDTDSYTRTTFIISRAGSQVNLPFIVTDKQLGDKFTNNIKAINYNSNYYVNDHTVFAEEIE